MSTCAIIYPWYKKLTYSLTRRRIRLNMRKKFDRTHFFFENCVWCSAWPVIYFWTINHILPSWQLFHPHTVVCFMSNRRCITLILEIWQKRSFSTFVKIRIFSFRFLSIHFPKLVSQKRHFFLKGNMTVGQTSLQDECWENIFVPVIACKTLDQQKISSYCLLILDIEGSYSPRGLDLESNIPKVAAAWCMPPWEK